MGLLDNKVSEDDIQRVNDIRHHPQYADGFDSSSGSDDFDDFFGGGSGGGDDMSFDMNDLFGGDDDSSGGFGNSGGNTFGAGGNNTFGAGGNTFGTGGNNTFGSNGGFGGTGGNAFGSNSGFGNNGNTFGSNGGFGGNTFGSNNGFGGSTFGNNGAFGASPFNNNSPFGAQAQAQQNQPDAMDRAIDAAVDMGKSAGAILLDMIRSLKLRNADDFGYFSRNLTITGVIMAVAGGFMSIVGAIVEVKMLSMSGLGGQSLIAGLLSATSGVAGVGAAALILTKLGDSEPNDIEQIPDIPPSDDNATDLYEDNIGNELDDLFGDDFDKLFEDNSDDEIEAKPEEPEETFEPDLGDVTEDEIDFGKELENIGENQVINRENLFTTFKNMFPSCTPKFAEVNDIEVDTKDFKTLETICLKALANLANTQLEELNSSLESARETFFAYELRLKRINKVKKTDDLAREIENYMREDSNDDAVNATVSIEGDFYKIIVTKGVTAVVTFGDAFKLDYCCDFFLNKKNQLPIIAGINELGKVIVEDAKQFDTMMIAGKPRSGKSWYVLSILMSMMLFNSPEDVQFCIVDPKESNLFKTIALMPHVFGLHTDEYIIDILNDLIDVEAPRRKKILADNRCDDIWALRAKNIRMPILYLVIDEYMTVIGRFEKDELKEFNTRIKELISQLPSLGIRMIFVPHRATGVVDKTQRTMLQFTAAVRANTDDVNDSLGITGWSRSLTKPGDIAVKSSNMKNAMYVRGAALTDNDGTNTMFIENAAKAFYKMGVYIPDMSNMRIAYNRDNDYIKKELQGDNLMQFDSGSNSNNMVDDGISLGNINGANILDDLD
jgi:hypothetical protein